MALNILIFAEFGGHSLDISYKELVCKVLFVWDFEHYVYLYSGNDHEPMVVTNRLMEVFPKLREGGGYELLKIAGSTHNRNLSLLQCPSTGYTIAYLKDPVTMIGHATI